ncbi:hypothetical protein [Streptomyces sp. V1I1]|nr:hypothetical protein [Streptomyces sp. V1I1]MDQ0938478.1 hypothetical protein [Streptomyces sp. V1I1]
MSYQSARDLPSFVALQQLSAMRFAGRVIGVDVSDFGRRMQQLADTDLC